MDFILLTCGAAGLLCGALLLKRGGLLAGCLVVLLAASCFGFAFYKVSLGPMPLTADRLLLGGLLLAYVVCGPAGLADRKPLQKADVVLLVFIGLLTLSTFTHQWQFDGYRPAAMLLFYYLMPLALYWVARQAQLTRRGVLATFALLGGFGLYLAVTAVAEVSQAWWAVYPKYIMNSAYDEFLGRGRGPFLNPIACGFVMTACLCAGLMWWPRLERRGQLVLAALAGAGLIGLCFTLTRSVWLGAALALAVIVGLSLPRVWRLPVVGGAVLAAALTVVMAWDHLGAFKRDRDVTVEQMAESAALRPLLARVAWDMFRDRPLLGVGFGQYERMRHLYVSNREGGINLEKVRPYTQHNTFLALLTQTGALGLGLFLILLGLWTWDAWRLWSDEDAPLWTRQYGLLMLGIVAAYTINAMFHETSLMPGLNLFLFFFAGVSSGLAAMLAAARREQQAQALRQQPW